MIQRHAFLLALRSAGAGIEYQRVEFHTPQEFRNPKVLLDPRHAPQTQADVSIDAQVLKQGVAWNTIPKAAVFLRDGPCHRHAVDRFLGVNHECERDVGHQRTIRVVRLGHTAPTI